MKFFALFLMAALVSPATSASPVLCPNFLESGFTVQVGEVSLHPERYLVRHGDRTGQFSPGVYMLFETLLLSQDYVRDADILDLMEDVGRPVDEQINSRYEAWQVSTLRRDMRRVFGEEFSRRILTLRGFGYAWYEPPRESEIQVGKIWKPADRPYYFYGDIPLRLTAQVYGIISAFRAVNCRWMDFNAINSYLDRHGMNRMARPEQIQSYVGKVNREISRSVGHRIKLLESAGYGTHMWKIRSEWAAFCHYAAHAKSAQRPLAGGELRSCSNTLIAVATMELGSETLAGTMIVFAWLANSLIRLTYSSATRKRAA